MDYPNKTKEELIIELKELEKKYFSLKATFDEDVIIQLKAKQKLVIANNELAFQNKEKGKRADELNIANEELAFQNKEKENRADELNIANKELAFQNKEKGKRADELVIANKELDFQNKEKGKRADELIIANKELAYQNKEKEKRADELIITNKKLALLTEQLEKKNQINEEKYKYMFDNNPQPMWIFDMETLAFLEINNAAINHYGYTREEFLAMTIKDIRPKEDINLLLKTKNLASTLNFVGEWRHLKKNGEIIIVEITYYSLTYNGREARHVIVNDITEKRSLELIRNSEKYLLEIITQNVPLPKILEEIVLSIEALSENTIASILLLDDEGMHVHYGAAPHLPESYNNALEGISIGPNAGSCGTAAYRKETVIVSDIEVDPLWDNYRELARAHGLRACWSTPIINSGGKVLGTFAMYYREPRSPIDEDYKLIEKATNLAKIAIERKRKEQELEKSQRLLIESQRIGNVGGWEFNIDTLKVTWTEEVFRIHEIEDDYKPTVETGVRFYTPESRPIIEQAIQQAIEFGKTFNLELEIITAKGNLRSVMTIGEADLENRRVFGFFQDITKSKKAEEALIKSEEKFASAFHSSPAGLTITRIADGKFIEVNDSFLKMFEFELEEVIGHTSIDVNILSPEARAKIIKMQLETGGFHNCELVSRSKSGKIINMLFSSKPITIDREACHVTTIIDISDRKLAEDALKKSEEEFRTLAESMPQIVWATRADGWNTYFNQHWMDYTGLTLEESNGHGWNIPFHPDDQQRSWDAWQNAVTNQVNYSIEIRLRRFDGEYRWFLNRGMPLLNEKGEILKWFGTCTDIEEIKKAEEEIKQSEKKFKSVFDASNVGKSITLTTGQINANQAFCEMLGYSREELQNKTWQKITPMEDIATIEKIIYPLLKGEKDSARFEKRYICKNGSFIWADVSVSIQRDANEKPLYFITTIIDITESKQAKNNLVASENRYRTLFENMTVGFVLFEVVQNEKDIPVDLIIITANEKFEETTGLKLQQVIGKQLTKVLPGIENDDADWIGTYSKVALTGEPVKFEQGSELLGFYYAVKAYKSGQNQVAVTFEDITKRKEVEKALLESEELLRLSTELANVGAWEMDLVTNSMTRSRNHDNLYGLKNIEKWQVNTFMDATHIDDREKCNFFINNSLAAGGPDEYKFDFRIHYPDQSIHWLNVIGVVIERDLNGVGTKIRGFITDITDRKKAEEELNTLNIELEHRVFERTKQLESANKELQTFTYSVSHDLKAPLRGIDGYSNLLQQLYAADLNEEAQNFIRSIRKGTEQMNMLIGDLLDYSRLERATLRIEPIKSIEFLKSLKAQFETEISSTKCDFTIKAPDIEIVADIQGLTIALRNLIENAIKFSRGQKKPAVEISLKIHAKHCILAVKDNGIGFDMKYKERIFDIFQQLNLPEDYPGTGIGLAMVHKSMDKMGGKVWAESKLGEGSIFYLEIPQKTKTT